MTKLKDLADSLALSQTTVSRALNGYPEVNQATRERVLAAAKAMGYRANPTARRLALGKSDTIGLIYPPDLMTDILFLRTVSGITETLALAQYDFHLIVAPKHNEMRVYQHVLQGNLVDGLIVARTQTKDARITYLQDQRFPFIAYGRSQEAFAAPWLDLDNEQGSRLAVDYFYRLGCRRIAYLYDDLKINYAYQRHQGYCQAMQRLGLPLLARMSGHNELLGRQAMRDLWLENIDAVIIDNPLAAVGAVREILAPTDLSTPLTQPAVLGEHLQVAVFGGLSNGVSHIPLPIVTIELADAYQVGEQLGQLILGAVSGQKQEPILWQPSLSGTRP